MAVQVHVPLRDLTEREVRHQQRRGAPGVVHASALAEDRELPLLNAELIVFEQEKPPPTRRGPHPLFRCVGYVRLHRVIAS